MNSATVSGGATEGTRLTRASSNFEMSPIAAFVSWQQARHALAAMLAIGAAAAAPPPAAAAERTVFRSETADGKVVYSDAPIAGAIRSTPLALEPHPADPEQARAAQRALQATRERLRQDSQARATRLAELDARIALAARELASAQSAQADGQAIGEGDRQGRRLTPAYWQRQQRLAETAARASMRLDRLTAQRAALL